MSRQSAVKQENPLKSRPSYGDSRPAVTDRNLCLSFPQHLHFVSRNGELRQTAIQTYRKLRPHPDDGLVQTFEPRKMKRNFAVKRLLVVRIASPARHGSRPRVSSTKGAAVGDVIPITPDRPKDHVETHRAQHLHEPIAAARPSRCFGASWRTHALLNPPTL